MKMIRQRRGVHDSSHPADALQLDAMAVRGELNVQVRWVHHLYFSGEAGAREASRRVQAAGWSQEWLSAQPSPYPGWVLRVARDSVVSHDVVADAREFFEYICDFTGGTYAGWDIRPMPKHALN